MADAKTLGYVCAGIGLGGAVGMLLAPKPGAETRDDLKVFADRGTELLKERAHAGKEHLGHAVEAGRSAYREASAAPSTLPKSSLASLGLLLFEGAALVAGYKLTVGFNRKVHAVGPQIESLVDAYRKAVVDSSSGITAVASKAHRVLGLAEDVFKTLTRRA